MRFCSEEKLPGRLAGRPETGPVIYCDGAGAEAFRPDIDLELSHWFPNRTPERFAADTSTEICLRFAASGEAADAYDLVVNNHVDVDGILSVFAILEPELALAHRDTVVQAAEMGDFWGWGERPAQVLCQAMTLCIAEMLQAGTDAEGIYQRGFDVARALLARVGAAEPSEVQPGLDWLASCVERIERGEIARTPYHDRFVHYALPRAATDAELAAALRVMPFSTPLSDRFALLPHARARLDRERIALQSVESSQGWYYDLCYPGYAWAETPRSWRPPGLVRQQTSNLHRLQWPALHEAVAELDCDEKGDGRWLCSEELSPFSALDGRGFPVVMAFMKHMRPAASRIPPERVATRLARAFLQI